MNTFEWEGFLRHWSRAIIESKRHEPDVLPSEIIEADWLGYPGASEEQIRHAENRLGISLPPSYREFLKVTNGWRQTTPFIYQLWSTQEIEWLSVRHPDWIDSFLEQQQRLEPHHSYMSVNGLECSRKKFSIPDEIYFIYGEEQDCMNLRSEYLHTALEISCKGDSAIYLLNPQVVTEEGEWEAWFFGDWLPGADRYRSFSDLMQAEYQNFLELQ
ncbi:SMI1/KNR4 family protein [Alkalinema sp. FACHB-956]|uniref:SMI1/KNR4 family protein n=1 Tax=Alkalinema sp. FACHB-956 TaxID=2692768 RepID=UPI001682BCF5|nr:SMI1/KNR4 family protein [Alkalinema sp. FACHB-956]MBD2326317.1 SMI1/KNR4 family protein [Alkalinema sp. FACHB-956]